MLIRLPNEFTLANFGLNHSAPNDFVKSQWQHGTKSKAYVIYRWIVAIVFIANLTLSLESNQNEREWKIWAIYLTRWGLVLNVFTMFLAATLVTLHNYNIRFQNKMNLEKRLPVGIQIYWALHSIAVTLAILITIVYWYKVHDYNTDIDALNILNHIVNSIILIIDLLVVGHPHRIFHVIYVHSLVVIYMIFSLIYYHAGGLNLELNHAIYPILDWTKVNQTLIIVIGVIFAIAVVHIIVHGIYRIRIWVYLIKRKNNNDNNTMALKVIPKEDVTIEIDNHAFNIHI